MRWEEVTITDLEARVSPEILARGQEYRKAGHILRACYYGQIITAEVAGTGGNYRVQMKLDDNKLDGVCTCPYPNFCKHMVALTLAWIEKSIEFDRLEPVLLEITDKPEQLKVLFLELVRKDPFNFLDLFATSTHKAVFENSRGILNLIRNTFQKPLLTHEQSEAYWERIKRIEKLVNQAIVKYDQEAPEMLGAFIKGIAGTYRDYPETLLENVFRDIMPQVEALSKSRTGAEIVPITEILWELYFDYDLWRLSDSIRQVLASLFTVINDWFLNRLKTIDWQSVKMTELILLYELLDQIAKNYGIENDNLNKTIEVLNKTPEGQLWLIDRIIENDPDRAYALAKEKMRKSDSANKSAFRERLIKIHLKRGENKQAAALCFIQFQEAPNLQEYLRIKSILAEWISELDYYIGKMEEIVEGKGLDLLGARLAFDRRDWLKLEKIIAMIDSDQIFLIELAELLSTQDAAEAAPLEVYQALITQLLLGGYNNWEAALSLLVSYKKNCQKNCFTMEWSGLRNCLNDKYGNDRKFNKKFGAVLA